MGSPLDGGLSGYKTASLIVGNELGECHAPCMIKTSFLHFEKEWHIVATTK